VSVIDLRKRFNQKQQAATRRNRILVAEHKGRLCGLIVDSASEVIKIPSEDVEPATAVFQDGGSNAITGLGKYKGRLIVLLDVCRLLDLSTIEQVANVVPATKLVAAAAQGKS
jgi:purine-binding chemotaxis protein CheW